jgi:hypothetical protein
MNGENFITYSTLCNAHDLVFRIMKGISGEDVATKTDNEELSQDIGAAINSKIKTIAGVR